ncbi:MAG: hypothetical protein ACP5VS_15995 [Desulfomonilaceae bacterium]
MDNETITVSTVIVAVIDLVVESVRKMAPIARRTLKASGSHTPTAILHTISGLLPILLPFENNQQKKECVEYVKKEALKRNAFAVTTITNSSIIDCRTGEVEDALVLATSIRGCQPYVVIQKYTRDKFGLIEHFYDIVEGDEAFIVGQMLIFPDWEMEIIQ